MAFDRGVLSDRLSPTEWQRLRNLQLGDPLRDNPRLGREGLSDDLPAADWQRLRDAQVRGLVASIDTARPVRLAAFKVSQPTEVDSLVVPAPRKSPPPAPKPPPSGPLRGRPGVAAIVAGALNTIAGGPNTSAPLPVVPFNGTVSRGAGRDIRAFGKIGGAISVDVEGVLDPPTGRAEISASGLRGVKGVQVPQRVRVYTTPTGELDVELSGPVGVGPLRLGKGTYYIGTPDRPKRR